MRVVDEVILDVIGGQEDEGVDRPNRTPGSLGFAVYDGYAAPVSDSDVVVVQYPLPYAVYYSNIGAPNARRLTGRDLGRTVFWSFNYVGSSRNQAKWVGERLRQALEGVRLTVPGHKVGLIEVQLSQRVRRDDDAIHADGSPLFYGIDDYALPIRL